MVEVFVDSEDESTPVLKKQHLIIAVEDWGTSNVNSICYTRN